MTKWRVNGYCSGLIRVTALIAGGNMEISTVIHEKDPPFWYAYL